MKLSNYFLLSLIYAGGCNIPIFAANDVLQKQDQKKNNLLLIVTDQFNFRTLGCYRDLLPKEQAEMWGAGNVVETPNIDAIAKSGILFNRMYASAPVCTPARASIFTGMYGYQLGMPNNSTKPGDGKYLKAGVITIADVLSKAGYMTGYSGKLHLAENTNKEEFWQPYPVGHPGYNYGFKDNKYMFNGGHEKFKGIDGEGSPYFASKNPKQIGIDASGQPVYEDAKSKNVESTTDWLADRTIDFIDENKDKPFFYVVSIPDPHHPYAVRPPYDTMYSKMNFVEPRTFNAPHPEGTPKWQMPDGNANQLFKDVIQYFGMVKCIDDNVGRILQKLKSEGVLENTIVVFTADHGDLMGEHARMHKGTIHEASARVPFVISLGKNVQTSLDVKGKVVNEAANTTDWMPTLLSLLGVKCPKVAGRDLSPLLYREKPADWHDITFSQLGFMAAIDSRYKLTMVSKEKPWLLDIQADPDELKNFSDDPAYRKIVKRLALELKEYMKKNNAKNDNITEQLNILLSK